MNFEQIQQKQEKKTEGQIKAQALADLAFSISDPDKRYEAIIDKNALVFFREDENNPLGIEVVQKMKQDLLECCKIQNKEEFQVKFFSILEPILNLEKENLKEFESLIGQNTIERFNGVKINDLLWYGKNKNIIHIHINPAKSMSQIEKLSNLTNGLYELADIVEKDKEIEIITATSSLVAERPEIVEKKLGFTIDGPITEDERKEDFEFDTRDISKAHIIREDFLNKYKK